MSKNFRVYTRRDLMKLAGVIVLAGLLSFCSSGQKRPNILFVITDDQSWEHVGCYGDLAVRTPAIDKLASEGVRFNNAYCAAPPCSPSRAVLI
jgi:N-sulfoglucosamine sulfohydrolase